MKFVSRQTLYDIILDNGNHGKFYAIIKVYVDVVEDIPDQWINVSTQGVYIYLHNLFKVIF